MRHTKVAPGISRLTHGISNFYLIDRGGRLALVDAGVPRDWSHLVVALQSMGRNTSDLDAIVLTHAHSDHTGFAERARSTGSVKVWVHQADAEVAKGGTQPPNEGKAGPYLRHLEAWRTLFGLLFTGGTKIVPILDASTFSDGAVLDVPGKLVVVQVPGHTAGSSALLLEDGGVVFTGDALVMRNPLTGRKGPQIMPRALNQSSQTALASLARLESLPADLVLSGHGEPWAEGIASAVKQAKERGPS